MPYSITREDPDRDLDALRDVINNTGPGYGSHPVIFEVLRELADSIEEQVKPKVEEPQEFGSIVRAGGSESSDRVLWARGAGHYWFSETARRSDFSDLHNPEVLRVGIADDQTWNKGYDQGVLNYRHGLRAKLVQWASSAITAEREGGFLKAIELIDMDADS